VVEKRIKPGVIRRRASRSKPEETPQETSALAAAEPSAGSEDVFTPVKPKRTTVKKAAPEKTTEAPEPVAEAAPVPVPEAPTAEPSDVAPAVEEAPAPVVAEAETAAPVEQAPIHEAKKEPGVQRPRALP